MSDDSYYVHRHPRIQHNDDARGRKIPEPTRQAEHYTLHATQKNLLCLDKMHLFRDLEPVLPSTNYTAIQQRVRTIVLAARWFLGQAPGRAHLQYLALARSVAIGQVHLSNQATGGIEPSVAATGGIEPSVATVHRVQALNHEVSVSAKIIVPNELVVSSVPCTDSVHHYRSNQAEHDVDGSNGNPPTLSGKFNVLPPLGSPWPMGKSLNKAKQRVPTPARQMSRL